MARAIRIGAIVLGAIALAVLGLVWALRPPPPLEIPEPDLVLARVHLVEPGRRRSGPVRLRVAGGRIVEVGPPRPGESDAYDGMVVLPGLNDLHVHFPPAAIPGQAELFAFLMLYHGITAVRDAGDVDGTSAQAVRAGLEGGAFPGPRWTGCGPFVDGEPPIWANSLIVRDAEEGRRAAGIVADGGYSCVKVYNGLDAPSLAALRDEAHARGLVVIGHVPWRLDFLEASLDDSQHMIGVPPPWDGRPPRYPDLLEAWLRLDDARLDALIEGILERDLAVTPTLVASEALLRSEHLERVLAAPDLALLPRFYREVLWHPAGGINASRHMDDDDFEMVRAAHAAMRRTVKRLHDAGVRLHSGTDVLAPMLVPGAALHRELRLLVESGLTPEQALAISTVASAEFLGVPGLGRLEEGAPAELVVFREDPTRDLAALDTIAGVVRGGRLFTREALDAQLARYRGQFEGRLYDSLVTPLVRRAIDSAFDR